MILPIVKYGDPVLTTAAEEIGEVDDEIRRLADDMVETMYAEPGIGLSANQVGVLKRVAVVDLSQGENPDELRVLINPEIVEVEGGVTEEEGCLSFPGIALKIERPEKVVVRTLDLEGEERTIEGRGILARALAHEIDHLNGVVFIDYLTGLAKQMVLTEIKRLKRNGEWD